MSVTLVGEVFKAVHPHSRKFFVVLFSAPGRMIVMFDTNEIEHYSSNCVNDYAWRRI